MANMESSQQDYQINLEVFQGPLDLLLFLIKKKKIDIHNIPIASITKEYLKYLDNKKSINLESESEFLLMAALLIHIKSRMLLPREASQDEEEDPRQILVDRLLDYKNIKAACKILREKEEQQIKKWKRVELPKSLGFKELDFMEVSLFDVAEIFFKLMKRQEKDQIKEIERKDFSVNAKKQEIIRYLKKHSYLDFIEYFSHQKTIEESLVSFFCLLELISERMVIAVQETLFHRIEVWLRKEMNT
ncbi:MAG: segregation and condensation protein A [Acidobacteriota bacterium]